MLQCSAIKQPVEPLNKKNTLYARIQNGHMMAMKNHQGARQQHPKEVMTFHTVAPTHPDIGVTCVHKKKYIHICKHIVIHVHIYIRTSI